VKVRTFLFVFPSTITPSINKKKKQGAPHQPMPVMRRPGAAQAASESDVPSPPRRQPAASTPAARAALLESPSGYHVAFRGDDERGPSALDEFRAVAAKRARR
jgi:hypothetical protein